MSQGVHLRKYGVETTIPFEIYEVDGVDLRTDWTPAAADCQVSKDEGTSTQCTNTAAAIATSSGMYKIVLTATEMTAARINLRVVDAATKVFLDKVIIIETYGHASAMHAMDFNDAVRGGLTALPNAAADGVGGLPISDAGGLDIDAKLANCNEVTAARMGALTDWINGGRLDLLLDAIKAVTDALPNAGALTDLASAVNLATVAGYLDTEIAAIKAVTDVIPDAGALTTIGTDTARLTAARAQAIDDWINGGRLDLLLDAIKAVTDALPDAGALTTIGTDAARLTAARAQILTDWIDGGRLDLLLDGAASAGDPWTTSLPGAYGAGTAGKIIGDNINAPIATVDTVVDAIKAKTDNLPTDPASETNVDANETKIDTIDTVVDAIKAKTDNLPADPADDSDIDAQLAAIAGYIDTEIASITAAIGALNDLSAAQVNTEVDTALSDIHLDHLLAADYDPASKPGIATALFNELVENDGGISRFTQNALEQSPSGGTNPNVLIDTTIAGITSQTEFTLTAGSNDDDAYKDQAIVLYDASDSDYPSIRKATAYVGDTKTLTIDSAPDFTITGGDGVKVFVTAPGTTAPTTGEIVSAWLASTGVTSGGTWTMAKWLKVKAALMAGNMRDKSGVANTYEILDPDDGSTVVAEVAATDTSPYWQFTIKI